MSRNNISEATIVFLLLLERKKDMMCHLKEILRLDATCIAERKVVLPVRCTSNPELFLELEFTS